MLAASINGFLLFMAACYELTLILCFSCLILLLFVANKFLLLILILMPFVQGVISRRNAREPRSHC